MARSNQKAGRELLRMRRAVGRAEQALADLDRFLLGPDGICASDLSILERLSRKGAQPVNDLGRRIGLTSGSITTAVQRLRKRALVETQRGEKDRRVVTVSISPEGKDLAARLSKQRSKALETVFQSYSSREQELLQSLLKRVRKATDAHHQTLSESES
jgi:MarR family 2-MHQ and catechol resistance regulon transcriptional repressor